MKTQITDLLTVDNSADSLHQSSVDLFSEESGEFHKGDVQSEVHDDPRVWTAIPRRDVAGFEGYADSLGLSASGKKMFLATVEALQISSTHIEFLNITEALSPSVVEDMLTGSVIVETGSALPTRSQNRGVSSGRPTNSTYRGFSFLELVEQKVILAHYVTRTSLPTPNERGSKFGDAKVLFVIFPETEFRAVNPENNKVLVDSLGKPAGFRPAFRLMARGYHDAPERGIEAWFNQSPRNTTTSQFGLQLPTLIREAALDLGASDQDLCVREESWVDTLISKASASAYGGASAVVQYATGGSNLRGSKASAPAEDTMYA